MPVTFGGELNYRMERIVFDVAEIPLPYNGILGRPALAKFIGRSKCLGGSCCNCFPVE